MKSTRVMERNGVITGKNLVNIGYFSFHFELIIHELHKIFNSDLLIPLLRMINECTLQLVFI